MAASKTTDISIWQKLDFVPAILQTLVGTLGTAVVAPFRGEHAPKTYKRHVILALMRRAIERLSPAQLQWLQGTTTTSYAAWTKKQYLEQRIVDLPAVKTSAFWIGDPSADTVALYFHGGGFALPAGDGHYNFLSQINSAAVASGRSLAFLVLQYDLAPGAQYPYQLRQCVELVRYATTNLKKAPSKLMLGGDSAGGNLVMSALLHLCHPHPDIEPLELTSPLKAAFMASPWVDFDMNSQRFRESDASDAASVTTLKTWAGNYIGTAKSDEWLEPAKADAKSWAQLSKVVDEILITVAKEEVMAGDVKRMTDTIETVDAKVKLFVAPDDFHAEPTLGSNAGFEMCEAAKVIVQWVTERC